MTNDQKILIEKSLGGIGVLSAVGILLVFLVAMSSVFTHGLEWALFEVTDAFAHGGFLLVILAVCSLWLRAFLRAGRLGS